MPNQTQPNCHPRDQYRPALRVPAGFQTGVCLKSGLMRRCLSTYGGPPCAWRPRTALQRRTAAPQLGRQVKRVNRGPRAQRLLQAFSRTERPAAEPSPGVKRSTVPAISSHKRHQCPQYLIQKLGGYDLRPPHPQEINSHRCIFLLKIHLI